jgi:hypothetical protein
MQILLGNNIYLDLFGTVIIPAYIVAVYYIERNFETVSLEKIDAKIDLILTKLK